MGESLLPINLITSFFSKIKILIICFIPYRDLRINAPNGSNECISNSGFFHTLITKVIAHGLKSQFDVAQVIEIVY